MKKKIGVVTLCLVLAGAWMMPQVANAQTGNSGEGSQVTHAELARIVVNLLALSRFLPADPSAQETFTILLQNDVAPPSGWEVNGVVTKGDLAVVIVKCLKAMGDDIDFDANDPAACLEYLRAQEIPIDTIGEGVNVIEPVPNPVAPEVFDPTSDPLETRGKINVIDEQEYGADATFFARPTSLEIQEMIREIVRPIRSPVRVTPFKP